jgi:hypothetical protein
LTCIVAKPEEIGGGWQISAKIVVELEIKTKILFFICYHKKTNI